MVCTHNKAVIHCLILWIGACEVDGFDGVAPWLQIGEADLGEHPNRSSWRNAKELLVRRNGLAIIQQEFPTAETQGCHIVGEQLPVLALELLPEIRPQRDGPERRR